MSNTEHKKLQFIQMRELLEDVCTDEYYKSDGYLLRWLQYANHDPNKAVVALKKCLEWRREIKIESILDEDFSDLAQKFPIKMSDVDKNGRMVLKIFTQTFNCKNLHFENEKERYIRFAIWLNEQVEERLKEEFKNTKGAVSQCALIVDCSSLSEHMKVIGMRKLWIVMILLKEIVSILSPNFPRCTEVSHVINASKLFTIFYSALKQFSCKETKEALHVHGCDSKFDWQVELFSKEI